MGVPSRQLTCAVFSSRPLQLGGSTRSTRSTSLPDHYKEVAPLPFTVGRNQPHRQELDQTSRNKKMCRKTEDARETLGQDDNHAGGCQKSCHFDQVRLQREPEQPYCGICQAYVEKCVCKEPRPL